MNQTKFFYAYSAIVTALILADVAFATMSQTARLEFGTFAVLYAIFSFFIGRLLNHQPEQK